MSEFNLPPGVSSTDIPGDRPEDHVRYKMDKNIIYNEDCLGEEGMQRLPDNSIDVTLTDIPYGEVNRADNGLKKLSRDDADIVDFDLIKLLQEIKRVTTQTVYIFCGFRQLSVIISELDKDMSIRTLIWEKPNPSPLNCHKLWLSNIELIAYGKFPNATFNGGYESSVINHKAGSSKLHPTMKPVDLLKILIKMSSNKGDLILDPFIGSGSTGVAAKSLGRKYIGFEKKQEYHKVAQDRVQEVQRELTTQQ